MKAYGSSTLTNTAVLLVANTTQWGPTGGPYINLSYYNLANPNSSLAYVQFFDSATSGAVTVGTTTPAFWIAVPANGGCIDTSTLIDYQFKAGIVVASTTTPTGSTANSSATPITIFIK